MHNSPPLTGATASDGSLPHADEATLTDVPRGAFALAGATVGLLVIAWLAIYVFIFLTRGPVG